MRTSSPSATAVTAPPSPLPEPVERVASVLREAGVDARIEEFSDGTPTAEAAARAAGCALGQIVKSLVFVAGGRFLVAMVPGDRRAHRDKVAFAAGVKRARVANAEEVEAATGFAPGAVAPFPLPGVDRVLIDRRLLTHEVVWTGAGSDRHMAAIAPPDLVRLTGAAAGDIVEDR
jgi:prolyl-tRNA editing enzyme YbaK/EbsC (Cys-tRNA(Pro) deacylase)